MFKPGHAAIFALSLMTMSRAAFAEVPSKAPSTVPELRAYAESVKRSDPARYKALHAEVERLEAKQRTSDIVFYGGMGAGGALAASGSALAPKKKCEEMPENTSEESLAKSSCMRKSAEVRLITAGVGLAVMLGSWIASEIVSPPGEDVRRAAAQRKAARRARVDVVADPRTKSVSAAMQFVF